MAGAKRRHDQIVVNSLGLVGNQLGANGSCRPFTSDTAIRIPNGNVRYPDLGVDCGRVHGRTRPGPTRRPGGRGSLRQQSRLRFRPKAGGVQEGSARFGISSSSIRTSRRSSIGGALPAGNGRTRRCRDWMRWCCCLISTFHCRSPGFTRGWNSVPNHGWFGRSERGFADYQKHHCAKVLFNVRYIPERCTIGKLRGPAKLNKGGVRWLWRGAMAFGWMYSRFVRSRRMVLRSRRVWLAGLPVALAGGGVNLRASRGGRPRRRPSGNSRDRCADLGN